MECCSTAAGCRPVAAAAAEAAEGVAGEALAKVDGGWEAGLVAEAVAETAEVGHWKLVGELAGHGEMFRVAHERWGRICSLLRVARC